MAVYEEWCHPLCESFDEMPSKPKTSYQKQKPAGAMVWYIHRFEHKFVEATRVSCHFVDGRLVYQIGTHGANCGNCKHVGHCKTFFQWMVEALRVAKSFCVRLRPKLKCILEAYVNKGWIRIYIYHYLSFPNGW